MRQSNLPRSLGVMRCHGPDSNARRAADTARLISSTSPSATRAMREPSAGLKTSKVLPEADETQRPLIRCCRGLDSQAARWGLTAGCEDEISPWPFAERLPARIGVVARPEARRDEASIFIWDY